MTVPANQTLGQRLYLTSAPGSAASATAAMPIEVIATDAASGRETRGRSVFHGKQPERRRHRPAALTGRTVALIAAGAFLFMLIPNIVLTVIAIDTFSGLVVPNSYVASQTFDRDRAAQRALGWTVGIAHEGGVIRLAIADAGGRTVRPAGADGDGRAADDGPRRPGARAGADAVGLCRAPPTSPPAAGAPRSSRPRPTAPRFHQSRDLHVTP